MRNFLLDDPSQERAEMFAVNHKCDQELVGAIGGAISYEFIDTSIGTITLVKCVCGAKENLTNYAEW